MATIFSAENLKRLDEFKDIQRQLADPHLLPSTDESFVNELIRDGKTVVITCSIHSTEVEGTFTATESRLGKGRVILFGFRPQYRAQTLANFPLKFNAILTSKTVQQ